MAAQIPLGVVLDEDDPSCADLWVLVQIGDVPVPFGLDSGARRSQVLDDVAAD